MARSQRTKDEWQKLLTEQRLSGLTQKEWCAVNGINLYTFQNRSKSLTKKTDKQEQHSEQLEMSSAGWVKIIPENGNVKTAEINIKWDRFDITVPSGFDSGMLTEVLRAVNRACC